MKPAREALLLSAACALAYFTGTADIPFYTRGEPREGLVVHHMVESGDWLVPARSEDEPARKPPLDAQAPTAITHLGSAICR